MENKRKLGQEQEECASKALEKAGYTILCRNYRCRAGEIDLIAKHRKMLVFIEVKYRKTNKSGYPEEAVDSRKQKQIRKVAAWYMTEHHLPEDTLCRFDVVAVTPAEIRVYQNAFS